MLYIQNITCVSPQHTFQEANLETLRESSENKLKVIDPPVDGIPPGILRRMGKAVRISVGAALPLLKQSGPVDGIIIGTANGGMEDCIKFMNQIIQYQEDTLTPGNFVQSTPNGIAAQLGLSQHNTGYNITHTHRGLSFENAILDAEMMLSENPGNTYLLGATDEISTYNYNVDFLDGWYKKETVSNKDLYQVDSPASLAGEGSVMCIVSSSKQNATGKIKAVHTLHTQNSNDVLRGLELFLENHLPGEKPELLLSGENGDNRTLHYYTAVEAQMADSTGVLRFKHMSGEYPTASAQAVWLACQAFRDKPFPEHMVKKPAASKATHVLIYNNYKGSQHSFILVSAA